MGGARSGRASPPVDPDARDSCTETVCGVAVNHIARSELVSEARSYGYVCGLEEGPPMY